MSSIVAVLLALSAGGCCLGVEPEPWSTSVDSVIAGDDLDEVRGTSVSDDDRCRDACVALAQEDGGRFIGTSDITSCEATHVEMAAGDPANPWDSTYTEVHITCTAAGEDIPFCTGRRPLGHKEVQLAVLDAGTWFAVHAHLERAAVAAFAELAVWLEARGAPQELVERCRAAEADERVHGELMAAQAHARNGVVPACVDEPSPDGLMDVALHNAVEGCVSEAFAAVAAAHQARHADDPRLREVFKLLAADELRHGQLAWDIDAWLWTLLTPAQRGHVARARRAALGQLPARIRRAAEATPRELGWPEPQLAEAMAREFASLVLAEPLAA